MEESCTPEIEYQGYEYVVPNYRNELSQTSKQILLNFKNGEIKYGNDLKSLAQMGNLEKLAKFYLDPDELLGRIDVIDRYHRHSFLPSLLAIDNPEDFVEIFFEHKWLFFLYEDFMRREPLIKWLVRDVEELKAFHEDSKSVMTQKLEEYIKVLEQMKIATNRNEQRFDVAKEMLIDICERGHKNNKRNWIVAELIVTEIRYLREIEKWLKILKDNVFKSSPNFRPVSKMKIQGMLPELHEGLIKFLLSLQETFHDFHIVEIMECFLEHEETFLLYITDRRVKSTSCLESMKREYPELEKMPDLTLDRVFKYPSFLERLHKEHEGNGMAQTKIAEVMQLFEKIKSGANNTVAINEIVESNITIDEQGEFLWRGILKISSSIIPLAEVNKKDSMVFLFEKCIIFTKQIRDKYLYIYHVLTGVVSHRKESPNDIIISRGTQREETIKLMAKDDRVLEDFEKAIKRVLSSQIKNIYNTD